jgi:hypothetical protein
MVKPACLLSVTLAVASGCAALPKVCVLDLPVYDPVGARLRFTVTKVAAADKPDVNLLKTAPELVTSDGDRVLFRADPDKLYGRTALITLEGSAGQIVMKSITLLGCPQRASHTFGRADSGLDVSSVTVVGRLSGCRFVGDWWIRVVPMFGGPDRVSVIDGSVGPDGSFRLSVTPDGVRKILVVGKGKVPIKAIGFNETIGRENNLQTVDVRGSCPND